MKDVKFKQMRVLFETDPQVFEDKANAILAQSSSCEITLDKTRPLTAYITYTVSRTQPETVLELLEMLDTDGGHAVCENCPAFIKSKDKRKKWGSCRRKVVPTKCDARACELYYLEKRREAAAIAAEFDQIPYTIE